MISRARWMLLLAPFALACLESTAPEGEVADVRGSWQFTADQSAPSVQLQGLLIIEAQSGDLLTGRLSWEERDAAGVLRVDGGAISGRVFGESDVDFDLLQPSGGRRHVARLSRDTMHGSWVDLARSRSGAFRAVRTSAAVRTLP